MPPADVLSQVATKLQHAVDLQHQSQAVLQQQTKTAPKKEQIRYSKTKYKIVSTV